MRVKLKGQFITVIILLLLVLVDQFIKYEVRTSGGFYVCNKGIAFGLNITEFLFWPFWIITIFLLLYAIYKKYFIHATLYLLLILSGAFSNLIDRLYLGCAMDYIDLKVWPVFNLADLFIAIGAIMLIARYITKNNSQESRNGEQ